MDIQFDQAALRALATDVDLVEFIGALGEDVAARANARAEQLFTDRGGGGIGSIESHVVRDERGVEARIGYPAEHFYMTLHEVGTSTEKPRPHLRPALFAARRASGGKDSAIRSIRSSKAAGRVTKRNRQLAKERAVAKKAAAKKTAAKRRSR